ncbi:hypothetical protein [Bordetella genomosp. 11]|uniref:hypothetical protein n=1 Tax=Bordetella genomosp. 11 TaxID=1416808 RepID=UPI0011402B87|nr:hypothetical protein [Bordetella genomosp. 11]
MIPFYSRVVAIDDNEDHLKKIVWGLGKAGFCPIPFLFQDGELENAPSSPIEGIRVVFTDIHMVGGGPQNERLHASNIIRSLRKIVALGPYVLIFWSQYPEDHELILRLIDERAAASGVFPPVGYGVVDKNDVFSVDAAEGGDQFNPEQLRELILQQLQGHSTMAIAASWEDRVGRAAARTTDRLFDLVKSADRPVDGWTQLLAHLASEATGMRVARAEPSRALDSALLPLLEDRLCQFDASLPAVAEDFQPLLERIPDQGKVERPAVVSAAHLNTSYLLEELRADPVHLPSGRGVVTVLSTRFVNSGPFIEAFGYEKHDLIRREFATKTTISDEDAGRTKLLVVELGPECDHVQGKLSTQRYLLSLLVPVELIDPFTGQQNKETGGKIKRRLNNISVLDLGRFVLREQTPDIAAGDWHLLVSCRCFMAMSSTHHVDGVPRFRLRRTQMDEIVHHYTTHARRPGVMRFAD